MYQFSRIWEQTFESMSLARLPPNLMCMDKIYGVTRLSREHRVNIREHFCQNQ